MAQMQTMQVGKHAVPVAVNEVGYDHDGDTFLVATGKLHFRFSIPTYAKAFAAINAERVKGGSIIIR